MSFFRDLFGKKPTLPNIEHTEEVVDWFIKYDDKIRDFVKNFEGVILDFKEQISYDLNTYTDSVTLYKNIIAFTSVYYDYVFPEAAKRYENKGPLPDDDERYYIILMLQESWLAAKMRIEGYFLFKKHGISLEDSYNNLINYKEKYRESYLSIFINMGLSEKEAENIFQQIYKEATQLSIGSGTAKLPILYGDYLLKKEKEDESIREFLDKKRNEGVTNKDILDWYNVVDIERNIMIKEDEFFRTTMFLDLIEKGMGNEEAAIEVRKHHPMYGNPDDNQHTTREDRPLPIELKIRVNNYEEQRRNENSETYRKDMEDYTSYNALIRKEMREGKL